MVTWLPPAAGEFFDAQAKLQAEAEQRRRAEFAQIYDPSSLLAGGAPPAQEATAPQSEMSMPAPLGGPFAGVSSFPSYGGFAPGPPMPMGDFGAFEEDYGPEDEFYEGEEFYPDAGLDEYPPELMEGEPGALPFEPGLTCGVILHTPIPVSNGGYGVARPSGGT